MALRISFIITAGKATKKRNYIENQRWENFISGDDDVTLAVTVALAMQKKWTKIH
jgi:hypothetical protein